MCGMTASALAAPADGMAAGGKPRGAGRVIDTHTHYFPRGFLEMLGKDGAAEGAEYVETPEGFFVQAAGFRNGPMPSRFWNLEERLADMDATGITMQVLSLTSPMTYWASPGLSERLSRAYNDACAEAHRQYPERFIGLATLPMPDIDRGLRELERARALPGIHGLYMGTHINGRDLSDPDFLPFFQAAEAAGLPIFLHPLIVLGGARLKPFYLNNLLGNPFEAAVAAAHLIFGGVLDRCPDLEVSLPHAGGALPILAGRLDRGARVRKEGRHMPRPPSHYLRRFTYDTISHSPEILRWLIAQVGVDRIVLGSDYTFDMGYDRPLGLLDVLGLAPDDRAMIVECTPARILGLAEAAPAAR
jgi:aminocarboxymuconate-semialdehyde decarboxylase